MKRPPKISNQIVDLLIGAPIRVTYSKDVGTWQWNCMICDWGGDKFNLNTHDIRCHVQSRLHRDNELLDKLGGK